MDDSIPAWQSPVRYRRSKSWARILHRSERRRKRQRPWPAGRGPALSDTAGIIIASKNRGQQENSGENV